MQFLSGVLFVSRVRSRRPSAQTFARVGAGRRESRQRTKKSFVRRKVCVIFTLQHVQADKSYYTIYNITACFWKHSLNTLERCSIFFDIFDVIFDIFDVNFDIFEDEGLRSL